MRPTPRTGREHGHDIANARPFADELRNLTVRRKRRAREAPTLASDTQSLPHKTARLVASSLEDSPPTFNG
jgi:hypothetical protein